MKKIVTLFLVLLGSTFGWSQETNDISNDELIKLLIQDSKTMEPLPYANILFVQQGKGTISNEAGIFSLSAPEFKDTDSISIQYIGYKNQKLSFGELKNITTIKLQEELVNLSEAWVYGNPPKAKDIIRKVIEHKEQNYKALSAKSQVFIRNRENTTFQTLKTNIKRNSISELDEQLMHRIGDRIPRELTSFTDFLGYAYTHQNSFDSVKITPQKIVALEEIEIAEMDQFGKIFENLFKETQEEEYWKVKSGIFSEKLDIEEPENDSIADQEVVEDENQMGSWQIKNQLINNFNYASLDNDDLWEFLHKPGKYKYELIGGTKVNGEDVFIIDFTPKGGKYIGRVYISTSTYALLKADYQYGDGKNGRDFQLLGVGYHENKFRTSIAFERINDTYQIKYLYNSMSIEFSLERNVSLLKKRKRWLFDEKLKEIKLKLDIAAQQDHINECLFIHREDLSENSYVDTEQPKNMDVVYVNQYSDDIWKGYPSIEPTKKMREYQKLEIDWSELGEK
jgi:hypothetical protein